MSVLRSSFLVLGSPRLALALTAACSWPVARQRALVGMLISGSGHWVPSEARAIQCGARSSRNEERRKLAESYFKKRAPRIASMREAIVHQLDRAKVQTLRRLRKAFAGKEAIKSADASRGGVAADIVFDARRLKDGLWAAVRSEIAEALQEAGAQAFEELGKLDPFAMPDPVAVDYLGQRENLLSGIADDVHGAIGGTIEEGMREVKSLAEIAREIRTKFAEIEEGRAETIAHTETGAAYGFSRQVAFRQAGVKFKGWLTSHLPNVRVAHRDAEDDPRNQKVPLEEAFHVGGELLMHPCDPAGSPENVINCHCIELAVAEEDAP